MTATTVSTTPFDARTKTLIEAGFVPGAPTAEAADIDNEVCTGADCFTCGRSGLEYHPFFRPARRGADACYIALGVCPACGCVEEF